MSLNYSRQNLRGHSFKGQNLSGANFSYADIRGVNFSNAILRNANFSGAVGGLQIKWLITFIIISNSLAIFFALSSLSIISLFRFHASNIFFERNIIFITISLGIYLVSIIIAAQKYFLKYVLFSVTAISIFCGIIIAISNSIQVWYKTNITILATLLIGALTISTFVVLGIAFSITLVRIFTKKYTFLVILSALIAGFAGTILRVSIRGINIVSFTNLIANSNSYWAWIDVLWGSIWVWAIVLTGNYIGSLSFSEHNELLFIRRIAIALSTIGSTNFHKADLQNANFQEAILRNTDFRFGNLKGTYWLQAKQLHIARLGDSYLKYSHVRHLLTSGCGEDKNFDRLNLAGINARDANLTNASFIGTDLTESNLQNADLSRAKLVQTQLDKSDFTGATLTGAFIQDWNITINTIFDDVRCEYIYMRLPTKDNPDPLRKPDNRKEIFAPGEFGDFIKPIVDTLDLYHSQNIDPRAIAISFKQLAQNYPDAQLRIVGMEVKGKDKFLLRAETTSDADKSELSAEYFDIYNQIRALTQQEFKALMVEKDNVISSLENMVTTALQRPSFYVETQINLVHQQELSEVAIEIQKLLEKLEQQKHPTTDTEKLAIVSQVLEEIKKNPTLEARVISMLKAGGIQTFKEVVRHPLVNILVAAIQGWITP